MRFYGHAGVGRGDGGGGVGAYGPGAACYYAKAKAENTAGGVTYETVCRGQDCEG